MVNVLIATSTESQPHGTVMISVSKCYYLSSKMMLIETYCR